MSSKGEETTTTTPSHPILQDPSQPLPDRHILSEEVETEMLQHIFSYLHSPGEERWSNMKDLKAISLTCKKLRGAVMRDLFRDMTLKFTYTYEWEEGRWMVPRLVRFVRQEPELGFHVRALRLLILPVSDRVISDVRTDPDALLDPAEEIEESVWFYNPGPHFPPCVSHHPANAHLCASNTPITDDTQDNQFVRLFGRVHDNDEEPIEEVCRRDVDDEESIEEVCREDDRKRQSFADYVLTTFHVLLPSLPNLAHLEPGTWLGPRNTRAMGRDIVSDYGLKFATDVILKETLPRDVSSLAIRGMQAAEVPWQVFRYLQKELAAQL